MKGKLNRIVFSIMMLIFATGHVVGQTYTVSNSNDKGPGSLRAAIIKANALNRGGTIEFNLDVGEQQVVVLHSPLPEISSPNLIINGRDKRSGVVISLDGRHKVDAPPLKFATSTSNWKNLDFINFVDKSIFHDPEDGVEIKVYPNPTSKSLVSVEVNNILELNQPILIDLSDMSGKSLQSQYLVNQTNSLVTNLELKDEMPNDTYIVSVRIGERSYKRKLVVH